MSKLKKPRTVDVCRALAAPVLEELGLALWDLRFEKEGQNWYLRFFIDKPGGVNITDCEAFSRAIDKLLDDADPIEQSYILEVSSPGIERTLSRDEHFAASIGARVHIRLIRPQEGTRDLVGLLVSHSAEGTRIRTEEGAEHLLEKADIAFVKIVADIDLSEGRYQHE